jgi:hypothetical protein
MTDFSRNKWTPSVHRHTVAFVAPWNSDALSSPAGKVQRRVSARDAMRRRENDFVNRRA